MKLVIDVLTADREQKWLRRNERARHVAVVEHLLLALHLDAPGSLNRAVALFVETEEHRHRPVPSFLLGSHLAINFVTSLDDLAVSRCGNHHDPGRQRILTKGDN